MAALIASKSAHLSKLLEKLAFSHLRAVSAAPSITRSFNNSAQLREREYDDDHDGDVDCRPHDSEDAALSHRRAGHVASFPGFFSDVFDPFGTTRSLSQVMNMMDQMLDNPFTAASRGGFSGNLRRGWDARENNDALYLRVDMPGLGKENVKVWAEQNTLVIKGEGEKETGEDDTGRKYGGRIDLPTEHYKMDQIKAEMKNGVLKVVVPKVKAEERRDVFEVKIQ
ncbi:Heat shock 22 kDa family protein [Rhynchospora pubera]|uniref:Heat shock 22 kDa family protein n=1 Tax=Rhynchospora pubera TaxID=906938 RepID=A0AAV8CRK9_9POAL|nr:Heat shock 22 kDa family protein [Rhynchospora pubera]